jgi:RNA polymerase sigma-54 factor
MQSISLIQENRVSLQQHQRLLVNLAMKQAFHVLQLPLLELSEWLKAEIEINPVLEIADSDQTMKVRLDDPNKEPYVLKNKSQQQMEKRRKEHQENLLTAPISLYEHLMKQVPLAIENPQNVYLAELIIGHLNDKGYLETPLNEIAPSIPLETMQKVLNEIQSFDPPGIGARNLQDCLLLQLKLKKKENGLSFKIISEHFDDLIHNRLPSISQKLHVSLAGLAQIIEKEIAPLDLHPGYRYFYQPTAAIIPDLLFICVEGKWQIEVNTSFLPRIQMAPIYLEAIRSGSLEKEESFYLRRQLASGRWLKRIVQRRNETLRRIGEYLIKKQMDFFNGDKVGLNPMTTQEVAKELGLHESTIARAIANKFIACGQGLFALRSFFNPAIKMQNGEKISKHHLRKILLRTIEKEDKHKPMSDEEIASHLRQSGISCARRTIAKYRGTLKIAPAAKRKKWTSQSNTSFG